MTGVGIFQQTEAVIPDRATTFGFFSLAIC